MKYVATKLTMQLLKACYDDIYQPGSLKAASTGGVGYL